MTQLMWMEWIATSVFHFSPSGQGINIPRTGAQGMSHNFRGAATNLKTL